MVCKNLILQILTIILRIKTSGSDPESNPRSFHLPGDILLGGLFPVHESEKSGDSFCKDTIQFSRGIQRVEAMKYAIEKLQNKVVHRLLNVKVGALIKDTCGSPAYAQKQSLDFIMASLSRTVSGKFVYVADPSQKPEPYPAVIGASSSSVSIQVANLLGLFHVSQVSPASTGHGLSDKREYPFFTRTVPPDKFQAAAMVDIVAHFHWTYVHVMSSEGTYGEKGIQMFREQAELKNICISEDIQIKPRESLKQFFEKVNSDTRVNVIVVFTGLEDTNHILDEAKIHLKRPIVWVGPDAWGKQKSAMSKIAVGAITITLKADESREFTDYLEYRRPAVNDPNPWLLEYWNQHFKCEPPLTNQNLMESINRSASESVSNCSRVQNLVDGSFVQDDKVPFVIIAVEAVFYALSETLTQACGGSTSEICPKFYDAIDNGRFHSNLLNVSFYGIDDNSTPQSKFRFDKNGDGKAVYKIYNLQETGGKLGYYSLAVWDEETRDLKFYGDNMDPAKGFKFPSFDEVIPKSRCSDPCEAGHQKIEHSVCCWVCTKCGPNQRLNQTGHCENCTKGWWPTADFENCYKLDETVIEWNSLWVLIPMVLSLAGIGATFFVATILILRNQTPIVKASGRELCFMILTGCVCCYLNTFLLVARPNSFVCGAQRILVGTSFCMLYAPLLTKTNRIYRIFQSPETFPAGLRFISPESQLILTSLLVAVQLIVSVVWLVAEEPGTRLEFTPMLDKVILKCQIDEARFTMSLVYNMLLIALCTVYAVKTRNIPENFNEAKFIGFAMYTTCIVWLAFVPLYFGLKTDFRIQISTLCVSISLSATVALICLFGPKLFIIFFKPEQNVRRIHNRSGTQHTRSTVASAKKNAGATGANCKSEPKKRSEKECPENYIAKECKARKDHVADDGSDLERELEVDVAEMKTKKDLKECYRTGDSNDERAASPDLTYTFAMPPETYNGQMAPVAERTQNGSNHLIMALPHETQNPELLRNPRSSIGHKSAMTSSSSEHDMQGSCL